jgi:integrator complex subunit 5
LVALSSRIQVSPDVIYNGLPWPDEEFSRVTVERDLKICITLNDHPILWKILWGLAEARPSLCYCSVLLRAGLAVQVRAQAVASVISDL